MSLTDRIKIYIDVVSDGATSGMRSFKTAVGEAEGFTGKFKAGIGSLGESLQAHAGQLAMAGGAAALAFGVKSVKAFQDTAIEMGKWADATGTTVEQASRLTEVADDLGISQGALQGAVQKFNKVVADGKAPLSDWGVEIVHAKDGSVDAYESFINAATAIGKIKDPTERAQAAQKAFGKSYGEIAEMMKLSAEQLRKKLNDVSDARVIDEGELDKAKKFREAMDKLQDSVRDLQLIVGEGMVPILTDLATAIGAVDDVATSVVGSGGLSKLYSWSMKFLSMGILPLVDGVKALTGAFTDNVTATIDMSNVTATATQSSTDNADAAKTQAEAQDKVHDALGKVFDALDKVLKAQQEQIDAQRAATDSAYALMAANDEYTTHLSTLADQVKEADGDQRKLNKIYDEGRQAAVKVADATVKLADEQAKASGATLSSTQRIDAFNQSMLQSAATASGPQRQAILDYVANVNNIPSSKATAIAMYVEAGDMENAKRLLNETSTTRIASVKADTDRASLDAARRELDGIAAPRTVQFSAAGGIVKRSAKGGPLGAGEASIVGDNPDGSLNSTSELFVPNTPGNIVSAGQTQDALRSLLGGGGRPAVSQYVDNSTHITNLPAGFSDRSVLAGQRRYRRIQGPT